MKQIHIFLSLVYSIAFFNVAIAKPLEGLHFSHHDWELACDNTGTCRAAGYHVQYADNKLSVLLSRSAGKGADIQGVLKLAEDDNDESNTKTGTNNSASAALNTLTMHINNKDLGEVRQGEAVYALSQKQTMALVKALSENSRIRFNAGEREWALSDKGGAAVLLKMDEFQKRLGTQSAAIRTGPDDESNVLKAIPMPVIKKPTLLSNSKEKNTLNARIKTDISTDINNERTMQIIKTLQENSTIDSDECPELKPANFQADSLQVYPLNNKLTLLSVPCWRAAYNAGNVFWLMDRDLNRVHELITSSGSHYDNGEIHESHKGRGLGDCWNSTRSVWNGNTFVLAEEFSTGMCRLIEGGGAWKLFTKISKIE